LKGRAFGRPRLRWEDNMKMALKEMKCEDVCWIHLTEERDQ
jgi:hypothetical protein